MPRYFFNFHDGYDYVDNIGTEHPDLQSVRAEAVDSLGDRVRGALLNGKDISAWMMNVTDEAGFTVMIVSLTAAVQIVKPVPQPA